jgi:hypothetical protein
MTPERMREILAEELSKINGAPRHLIDQITAGTHGEAIGAALTAMQRVADECRGTRNENAH